MRLPVVTAAVVILFTVLAACDGDSTTSTVAEAPSTAISVVPTTTGAVPMSSTGAAPATTGAATTVTEAPGLEIAVEVEDGTVIGEDRHEAELGEAVTLTVESDVDEEVHVHTYDLVADVAPGSPAVIEFVADIPGIFEVELEGSGLLLFELVVE